eukprot:2224330-Prymnesium_polylepis.1
MEARTLGDWRLARGRGGLGGRYITCDPSGVRRGGGGRHCGAAACGARSALTASASPGSYASPEPSMLSAMWRTSRGWPSAVSRSLASTRAGNGRRAL